MSLHAELTASFVCVVGSGLYEFVCMCAYESVCPCTCVTVYGEARSQS